MGLGTFGVPGDGYGGNNGVGPGSLASWQPLTGARGLLWGVGQGLVSEFRSVRCLTWWAVLQCDRMLYRRKKVAAVIPMVLSCDLHKIGAFVLRSAGWVPEGNWQ